MAGLIDLGQGPPSFWQPCQCRLRVDQMMSNLCRPIERLGPMSVSAPSLQRALCGSLGPATRPVGDWGPAAGWPPSTISSSTHIPQLNAT